MLDLALSGVKGLMIHYRKSDHHPSGAERDGTFHSEVTVTENRSNSTHQMITFYFRGIYNLDSINLIATVIAT